MNDSKIKIFLMTIGGGFGIILVWAYIITFWTASFWVLVWGPWWGSILVVLFYFGIPSAMVYAVGILAYQFFSG